MTSSSDNDTFEAYQCPECGHIQEQSADCENCSYGEDDDGWNSVKVQENAEGDLVTV